MNLYLETFAFMGGLIIRFALAAILAQSALHALRDLATHIAIIEQYRIVPAVLASPVAIFVPVALLISAVGLLVPDTAQSAALLGTVLMTLFTLAISINLARGRDAIDCGCGGAAGQRLSPGLVIRNVVLGVLLLCAAFAPSRGAVDVAVVVGVLGGATAFVAFYFTTNALLNTRSIYRTVGGGPRW